MLERAIMIRRLARFLIDDVRALGEGSWTSCFSIRALETLPLRIVTFFGVIALYLPIVWPVWKMACAAADGIVRLFP